MSATDESMHAEYDALASHLLQVSAQRDSPYWVGIAGGPGSGKSTLSAAVASRINTLTGLDVCVVLPMDGFHYSRQQLREMGENGPYSFEELIARRGSLWTFDGEAIVSSLAQARANGRASLPVYSRQISDPVPDGVQLLETHKLVLVEGNYLLNWDDPLWGRLRSVLDERWFISCENIEQQRGRLIRRHLETWTREKEAMWGVGEEGAAKKADANDVLNAQFVAGHQKFADRVIISK